MHICQYSTGFFLLCSLRNSGQHIVKTVGINSHQCSFARVARCFDFANFITENKNSQQHVPCWIYKNESYTGIFLGIYFLEPFSKTHCIVALTEIF